jgi:hypothetical protein
LNTEKRLKFHNRVWVFLDSFDGHCCLLWDVEKIHGSLCHVAFVYTEGRSRLPSLSNFAASFKGDELTKRYPTRSTITDLKRWLMELGKPVRYRELRPRGEIQDLGIYVDASTSWGIGIIIRNRWAAFKLRPDWSLESRRQGHLLAGDLSDRVSLLHSRGYGHPRCSSTRPFGQPRSHRRFRKGTPS